MKPGAKPKPAEVRELEGNPGNTPMNDERPKCEAPAPIDYPEWMRENCEFMVASNFPQKQVAQMVWDGLYEQLTLMGVLKRVDADMFGRYCDLFARWLKAKAFIDEHGETYVLFGGHYEPTTQPNGEVKNLYKRYVKQVRAYPQVGIYKNLLAELRHHEAEFGIGAAARTSIRLTITDKLNGDEGKKPDDFDYSSKDRVKLVSKPG